MIIAPTTHLLTLDDVAAETGVVRRTVEEWIHAKDLGSFKKGGCRRVSLEHLTKFVLLHTFNPRRPEWLTAQVEGDFQKRLREMVQAEFNAEAQRRGERIAA